MGETSDNLIEATDRICRDLEGLEFGEPVTHVYNPLEYARNTHQLYIEQYGDSKKRVLLMGMNPGPWGMAQTGVPFGEIPAVRDWMKISGPVNRPDNEHPKRPIVGFDCEKSEVSGRRLWGLFSGRFPDPADFFAGHYVVNYCPLVWMEETGRNRTPDKIQVAEIAPVHEACDRYVQAHIEAMDPEFLVGVGAFAEKCLIRICEAMGRHPVIGKILHPSPASPAANRDWAGTAEKQLKELGVW